MEYLSAGLLLGLSAGVSPGPLLALVITETLKSGVGGGVRVALAPLLTDLPIVLVSLWLVSRVTEFTPVIGTISLLGGCFVFYLGIESFRAKGVEVPDPEETDSKRSLFRGILTNALSPHPYLFWITVGGPMTMRAWNSDGSVPVALFVVGFYSTLVGSKVVLALVAGRSRKALSGKAYLYTMRVLGGLLCLFAVYLFVDGAHFLGWF